MDEKTNETIVVKISEEMVIRCLRFISNSMEQEFDFFEFGDIKFKLVDVDNESFDTKFKIDEKHYNKIINKIDECIKICQKEKIKEYLQNLKNRFEIKNNIITHNKKISENLINTIEDKEKNKITEILKILKNKKSLSPKEQVIKKL